MSSDASSNGQLRTTTDSIDRVYAQALFEMSQAQGNLEAVAAEVDELAELLKAEPELYALLTSRVLGTADRAGVIERLFKGRLSDGLYRFVQVVNAKERTGSLRGILQAFGDLVAESQGLVEVDVYVANRLDKPQADAVAESIGQALGKRVALHQYVEPDLIGGLKIRVGDRLIDGSVATQLKLMKRKMTEAGRQRARQMTAAEEA